MTSTTLPATLDALLTQASRSSRSIVYLRGETERRSVPLADLRLRALGLLHHLQKMGARRGDALILFLSNDEAFIDAFWAGILGGLVPVPVAVGISDEHRHKLLRIAAGLRAPWIYTERKTFERLTAYAATAGAAPQVAELARRALFADAVDDLSTAGEPYSATPADTAFIQFSSGSTSEPKGVVLTHANLVANWQGAAAAGRFSADDVALSWMPLTHDMGLIGMHIFMMGSGMQLYQMPTDLFVRRPLLWLQLASAERATLLCSPNFGYRHYLKVLGDRAVGDLDLSAVRIIFNGAEPISADLAGSFLARLAPARLDPRAMFPVYGLAEASVAVSFPAPGAPLCTLAVSRHGMAVGAEAVPIDAADRDAVQLVAVGRAVPNCELRIVDDRDAPLRAGCFGHIQIRGGNVTAGYAGNSDATQAAFTADGWLRTGDLGALVDGQLYVSGRAKDIIFVNGQNYYPQDLEGVAIAKGGLELGKVAVSGVRRAGASEDEIVAFVLHRGPVEEFLPVAVDLARCLNEQTGLEVAEVVPVRQMPKTTSGKIQRHALEQALLDGAFTADLARLQELRGAALGSPGGAGSALETRLKAICDAALGRSIEPAANLFEIGASSLKLIEIHEKIDAEYPGLVDLTELFDFPTIAQLAAHLETKRAAQAS
jgi:acyl-CoA synthetase (AMP-forming)/AMP-acid ligase II/acyl carrier protein